MKTVKNTPRGFIIGYVFIFSIVFIMILMTISALMPSRNKSTLSIKNFDKARYLAQSGINAALAQLRTFSTRTEGMADIKHTEKSTDKNLLFSYSVELSTETVFMDGAETLLVSATSYGIITHTNRIDPSGKKETTRKTIHAYVQVNTLTDYFEICTKTLTIARGLDLSNASIYGNNLVFLPDGSGTTKVQKASYHNSVQNDTANWVEIDGSADQPAQKLTYRLDLPIISEIINSYIDLASLNNGYGNSVLGHTDCTNGYTSDLSSENNIYPPKNGTGVYYSSDPITIGNPSSPTYIHGQMIFVTTNSITIKGDLLKCYEGRHKIDIDNDGKIDCFKFWHADYHENPIFYDMKIEVSLAGLLSGGDILVSKTNSSNQAIDCTVESLILASQGFFRADQKIDASNTARFQFLGAIMISEGIIFSDKYTLPDNRIYLYDEHLRTHGLPNMPFVANVLYWNER